jgi:hypothetical protein
LNTDPKKIRPATADRLREAVAIYRSNTVAAPAAMG